LEEKQKVVFSAKPGLRKKLLHVWFAFGSISELSRIN
jgi:hypothetical protein